MVVNTLFLLITVSVSKMYGMVIPCLYSLLSCLSVGNKVQGWNNRTLDKGWVRGHRTTGKHFPVGKLAQFINGKSKMNKQKN